MSRRRKFVLAGVALLIVCAVLVVNYWLGAARKAKPNIVVVLPSDRNPFWIEVRRGAEKAASELSGSASVQIAASNDQDATSQNSILDTFFSRKQVSALVLGPADDHATVPKVAGFLKDNIPVIVIDTELNKEALKEKKVSVTAFLGSNNKNGGEKAAREMASALDKKAYSKRVLLLEGNFVHQSAIDRSEGFQMVGKQLGLDIKPVRCDWKREVAQEVVATHFGREHFGGIFASNDDMALAAINALKSLKISADKWPIVIGFDATKEGLESIAAGEMYASVKQDASLMGSEGVKSAMKALKKDSTLLQHRLLEVQIVPSR